MSARRPNAMTPASVFRQGLPAYRTYKKPSATRASWAYRPRQARELLKREQAAQ